MSKGISSVGLNPQNITHQIGAYAFVGFCGTAVVYFFYKVNQIFRYDPRDGFDGGARTVAQNNFSHEHLRVAINKLNDKTKITRNDLINVLDSKISSLGVDFEAQKALMHLVKTRQFPQMNEDLIKISNVQETLSRKVDALDLLYRYWRGHTGQAVRNGARAISGT